MSDIIFTLKNKTNDKNLVDIVLFQKNENEYDIDDINIAWKVIENSINGMSHTIKFPRQLEISIKDSNNNNSPKQLCAPGEKFSIINSTSGVVVNKNNEGSALEKDFEILNLIEFAKFSCQVFRGGKLLSKVPGVLNGKSAKFEILPKLYIGVISILKEGDVMNSAIYTRIDTVFNLEGIKAADIVMRGGGNGKDAKPYTFDLVITENV